MPDYDRSLQDIKADIKARTDIVDVVGQYTRLKRSGKNWTGLCPFHADKKPSFSVDPTIQRYKCWSCGEDGDIFTIVQKKEGLEFIEALELLAQRAGVPFERKAANPEAASEREQMLELNLLAVQFFQDRLVKSPDAQAYLAKRAILKTTQEQFQLGFAPDDWQGLTYHFERLRVNLALAAKIGLIKKRAQEGSGYYDTFRNRLMFPIQDVGGRVIAFGGRAMGDDPAKYLNSEASALFDKSRTLYGLNFARKKLSGDTPAVFVEGYVDVVTTHQAGFTQCVATLGTSMTEEHARALVRYNPRVIICYDGDAAGIKATLRGAAVWEMVGVEGAEVRVARLPAGDDPDSLLKRGETAAFQAALDNAVPRVEFQIELIQKQHDLQTEEGRADALAEIIPVVATIPTNSERARYAQRLAHLHPLQARLNINRAIEQILLDIETYARQTNNARSPRDRNYPLTEASNRTGLEGEPPPPTYRPPDQKNWGRAETFPYTDKVIRKGEGSGKNQEWGRNAQKNGSRRRYDEGPHGDPTPPPLVAPALTGAEKAERQLLRACLSPQWRTYILSRIQENLLITREGRRLFGLIARTPGTEEGGIDPLQLMNAAEAEDEKAAETNGVESGENGFSRPESPEKDENFSAPVKISYFLRELLEESVFLVSNEHLNETAVSDCIRRLQKYREQQAQQELAALLQRLDTLPPEERSACIQLYHQKMRESRGSSPAAEGG